MKALKNDGSIYAEQIAAAIAECYGNGDNPSNQSLLELYAFIGQHICLQGEKAFVAHLAEMLTVQLPTLKGFSLRNLRRMRDFYRTYANNQALMEKALSQYRFRSKNIAGAFAQHIAIPKDKCLLIE